MMDYCHTAMATKKNPQSSGMQRYLWPVPENREPAFSKKFQDPKKKELLMLPSAKS